METKINIESAVIKFITDPSNGYIQSIVSVKAQVAVFCIQYDVAYTQDVQDYTREDIFNRIIVGFESLVNDNAFCTFADRLAVREQIRQKAKWKHVTDDKYFEEWNKRNDKMRF